MAPLPRSVTGFDSVLALGLELRHAACSVGASGHDAVVVSRPSESIKALLHGGRALGNKQLPRFDGVAGRDAKN